MPFQDNMKEETVLDPVHILVDAQLNLKNFMRREITLIREMLSSMQREQDTLLLNNTLGLKSIMKEREELFEAMVHARNQRMQGVKNLAHLLLLDSADKDYDGQWEKGGYLDHLLLTSGSEGSELLWLRDQMLALIEKMNEKNSRNNYLIQNRIRYTRQLMQRLDPNSRHPVYCENGKYAKKQNVTTITLINQEG